jgi:2,4-dienoyl-CoA reductase-like NADH-dependent reductase (Old Yellow Enzyme family)
VGESYPVGCRYLVDEVIEGGNDVDDAQRIGLAFAEAGMDFLSLSKGGKFDDARQPKVGAAVYPYTGPSGYECMPTVYGDERGPFYRNIKLMASVRRAIRKHGYQIPIVVAGGINDFEGAEAILQNQHGDIIGAARQSLADPDWFLKMSTGHGKTIRRCKFTNYCEALDTRHKEVTCQLWDRVQITEPGIGLSADGKRRLCAPLWEAEDL